MKMKMDMSDLTKKAAANVVQAKKKKMGKWNMPKGMKCN